ncbi:L-threonylcarbamoyladenylate synthase [Fructobacillus fructosus]|uniref:L-threonylcarbamoyladenylate synthase n=1 Tax=Fructobacillus fructosus TaxID=1631 RepID=UPI001658C0DB|nr:L-threonylcarbamoyladenylate synthase [Fructobacillus fructosus]MBC9119171.1 threonylcarbamoyl-AMP synthase [Fructobacillus fructosus]MBD9366368.1 threonylcarbamoyl-AMP synthase [Leuconostoc mesenteroides]
METKTLNNSTKAIEVAAKLLQSGEVVAFPTETVYGLGADATNDEAVKKVFVAKGRPSDNPLIMTVGAIEQLQPYVELTAQAKELMTVFWPGSLTIILPIKTGMVSMLVTGGLETAAVRMPANQVTRQMIRLAGVPIVGPSANTSGKPSPTTAAHVKHDMAGKIAAIVDDGPTQVGVESTVVDLTAKRPTILRTGAVSQGDLEQVLKTEVIDATSQKALPADQVPKAPGMKYRHYAPDKEVVMFDPLDWQDLQRVLTTSDAVMAEDALLMGIDARKQASWSLGTGLEQASENLFAGLRYFDDQSVIKRIYVESMPDMGIGRAYNNRLGKASGGRLFQGLDSE